jgi:hypothetical protein
LPRSGAFSTSCQFIVTNNIAAFFGKGVTGLVVFVPVIIEHAITLNIDGTADKKFNLVFVISNVGHVCKEAVKPPGFVEYTDV